MLQEAVGEAAGGGPGVEAGEAGDVEVEVLDCGEQLVAAPADEAVPGVEGELGVGFELFAGLFHADAALGLV